jgi:hypothetical protein
MASSHSREATAEERRGGIFGWLKRS